MTGLAVFGNSVSLADPGNPSVRPWPDLLRERLAPRVAVRQCSVGGAPITEIVAALMADAAQNPHDAVVLQAGIVDCAPRPLRPSERALLGRIPGEWLRRRLIALVHDHRARIIGWRSLVQTTPLPQFAAAAQRVAAACSGRPLAVLPILPVTDAISRRNPRLGGEIDAYNAALRAAAPAARHFRAPEIFGALRPEDIAIAPESVHLNERGHACVADAVEGWARQALGVAEPT